MGFGLGQDIGNFITALINAGAPPAFNWSNRPAYSNGTQVAEGDTIILKATRFTPPNPIAMFTGSSDEGWVYMKESNSKWITWSGSKSDARKFKVKKDQNRCVLIDVETNLAMRYQGDWYALDTYDSNSISNFSIACKQNMIFFEADKEPMWCVWAKNPGAWSFNNNKRGQPVTFELQKV
ncbi:hypothetical protein AOQ84DRAFT_228372 [Glonium stellatum]|uniref:Uncharacterized protein n=1 Tax=Glonium stellatum TaxID=574774 RepID=A0A8E2EQI3_9PEZI|nr:hypothetical protein AOQ84DRAFT_228372 [Glonium stellatum]